MHLNLKPELLDKIRDSRNLTNDAQLAVYLGLSAGTLSRIRAGKPTNMRTVAKVLAACLEENLLVQDIFTTAA